MFFQLTQKHIDRARSAMMTGGALRSRHCPLAQCLKEVFPAGNVSVGGEWCHINSKGIALPVECKRLACNFDLGKAVYPMTFTLDVPS